MTRIVNAGYKDGSVDKVTMGALPIEQFVFLVSILLDLGMSVVAITWSRPPSSGLSWARINSCWSKFCQLLFCLDYQGAVKGEAGLLNICFNFSIIFHPVFCFCIEKVAKLHGELHQAPYKLHYYNNSFPPTSTHSLYLRDRCLQGTSISNLSAGMLFVLPVTPFTHTVYQKNWNTHLI